MVHIRTARVADAEGLVDLDRLLAEDGHGMVQTVEQVRPVETVRQRLAKMETELMDTATLEAVAVVDAHIVGSARLQGMWPARIRHVGVLMVGVHPLHQRRGIGRALMAHLIEHARHKGIVRLELNVRADNIGAQALYCALGFVHEGTRARFIRLDDGTFVDDLTYCRFLG
jgi:putative acetyltransferase